MEVVYHGVPAGMAGEVLYPLNRLAAVEPGPYERQLAKYAGREELLELQIPGLDLLWNDVLHCSPLHPRLLYEARRELGLPTAEQDGLTGRFFEVPLERILVHPVVWLSHGSLEGSFEPFDAARYQELTEVPAARRAYLREAKAAGRHIRAFAFVPHVLVAGPVDVRGLRTFAWGEL